MKMKLGKDPGRTMRKTKLEDAAKTFVCLEELLRVIFLILLEIQFPDLFSYCFLSFSVFFFFSCQIYPQNYNDVPPVIFYRPSFERSARILSEMFYLVSQQQRFVNFPTFAPFSSLRDLSVSLSRRDG